MRKVCIVSGIFAVIYCVVFYLLLKYKNSLDIDECISRWEEHYGY